jgi:hypothetical protein
MPDHRREAVDGLTEFAGSPGRPHGGETPIVADRPSSVARPPRQELLDVEQVYLGQPRSERDSAAGPTTRTTAGHPLDVAHVQAPPRGLLGYFGIVRTEAMGYTGGLTPPTLTPSSERWDTARHHGPPPRQPVGRPPPARRPSCLPPGPAAAADSVRRFAQMLREAEEAAKRPILLSCAFDHALRPEPRVGCGVAGRGSEPSRRALLGVDWSSRHVFDRVLR